MATYEEIDEKNRIKIQTDGFLRREELMHLIDLKFGYRFEGKKIDDNLISEATWRKYLDDFFNYKNEKDGTLAKYANMLRGGNSNREYHIDFIEELLEFKNNDIINHLNSNRKTIKNPFLESFSNAMGLKFENNNEFLNGTYIKNGRMIKTQYEYYKENPVPILSEEEKEDYKNRFMEQLIDILIDKSKVEEDIECVFVGEGIHHGEAEPREMIEDEFGPLDFKMDWTNYLKENVINHIKDK